MQGVVDDRQRAGGRLARMALRGDDDQAAGGERGHDGGGRAAQGGVVAEPVPQRDGDEREQ